MLQMAALFELFFCWVSWSCAFVSARQRAAGQRKVIRAPSSWWGFLLQALGMALASGFVRPAGFEKSAVSLIVSMLIGPPNVALGWAAARHLGKQWRYEAALNEDHELIQTGPYRWVRHPIYTSMLGLAAATGAACAWWPMLVAGLIVFLAGTEVRVRAEERLLAQRFGESFTSYRARVGAYIPFLR